MPKFDERPPDAVTIDVRQNEVVVVTSELMNTVHYMFTVGLSPCVGLVLWCPAMCVVGHFHHWNTMDHCDAVIERFAEVSGDHKRARKCVLIRAIGNPLKGAGWHSEHMVSDMRDMLKKYGLSSDEVRPARNAESAKVCVCLEDGAIEYGFNAPAQGSKHERTILGGEGLPDWVKRPTSAEHLVIGVYKAGADKNEIHYRRGHEAELLRSLLQEWE
jgi:hypothetical protein